MQKKTKPASSITCLMSLGALVIVMVTVMVMVAAPWGQANVLGTDYQTFNPINNGLDFTTVHSSKVLTPGTVNLGFFLNTASNTLPLFKDHSSQNLLNSRDRIYSMDLNAALGLIDNWEIGVSFPYLVRQDITGCDACAFFEEPGFTETRVYIKNGNYRLGVGGFAWVASISRNQIEQNPFSGNNSGPTSTFELVYDRPWRVVLLSFNIGHRWRQMGERMESNNLLARVPNQAIYSASLSYYKQSWDSNFIFEIFGSQPTQRSPDGANYSDRSEKGLEALAGIKHQISHQLAFHAGGGRQLLKGFGTPDLRLYSGVNYAFGIRQKPTIEGVGHGDGEAQSKEYTLKNMGFEFDSTILTAESERLFQDLTETILALDSIDSIEIEGHTDSIGNDQYNLELSRKRAESLKVRLGQSLKGRAIEIPITAIGYGEERPIASNRNFQGRAENRRVVIKVYLKKKP